jgi:hypothetical protein
MKRNLCLKCKNCALTTVSVGKSEVEFIICKKTLDVYNKTNDWYVKKTYLYSKELGSFTKLLDGKKLIKFYEPYDYSLKNLYNLDYSFIFENQGNYFVIKDEIVYYSTGNITRAMERRDELILNGWQVEKTKIQKNRLEYIVGAENKWYVVEINNNGTIDVLRVFDDKIRAIKYRDAYYYMK